MVDCECSFDPVGGVGALTYREPGVVEEYIEPILRLPDLRRK
jgi:hypothetical protein